jgi:hypothetical protein
MPEVVFEAVQEPDGGYCAECLTENIFTEGQTWDELRKNALETSEPTHQRIAIPNHQPLRLGTLNAIPRAAARRKGVAREAILADL